MWKKFHLWICSLHFVFIATQLRIAFCSNFNNTNTTKSLDETPSTKGGNIQEITQKLMNSRGVNKFSRPYAGVKPLVVKVEIFLVSVGEFRETDMEFKIEMYFRQYWRDPRLAHGVVNETITISGDEADNFWQPDTYFENEKSAMYHVITTKNKYIRIYEDGELFTSTRITLSVACPMGFQRYPMDYQTCELHFGSYGFTTKDLVYEWHENKFALSTDIKAVAQFAIPNIEVLNDTDVYSTGSFSMLFLRFQFARRIGHYFIRIYIPAILIVMVSWMSFYIDKNSAPARVSLGITTVLTMTTLLVGVGQGSLPVVSYVKAVDWYLIVCYMMVFSAFVEYAFVTGTISRRSENHKTRKQCTPSCSPCASRPDSLENGAPSTSRPESYVLTIGEFPGDWKVERKHLQDQISKNCENRVVKQTSCLSTYNEVNDKDSVNIIDKWSRRIFPLIFFTFNLVYWLYYLQIEVSN